MKNDYIEIDGKKYRVEFTWEAIVNFLEDENLALSDVDDLKNLKPRQVTSLIFAGVVEGCQLDNVEFPFSKKEFSSMIRPYHIGDLITIYTRQTLKENSKTASIPEPVEGTKKKKFLNLHR